MGTMSGGSLTIRGSPSTTWVSLSNAWRLSFVRAFVDEALGLLEALLAEQRLELREPLADLKS